VDPEHAPAFRERARCLTNRGQLGAALPDADRALALDPNDLDTALVRAEVLDRLGRTEEARRALRSIAARRPTAAEPWTRLQALAQRTGDAALAREAGERLRALSPAGVASAPPPEGAPLALLDRAILAGDLPAAQKLALRQRLPGAEIALRAVALGRSAIAREQAELLLGADPDDTSARIALVAVADLRGDLPAMAALMRAMPRRSRGPSALGRWLFADALRRRVGVEAALAWLGSGEAEAAPGDPLLAATEKRVRASLATR
jgi:tetratricopeptide (TPR) repeat protein